MRRLFVLFAIVRMSVCINANEKIYIDDINVSEDSVYLIQLKHPSISYFIEARAALAKNDEQEGKSPQEWGIVWNYKTDKDFHYAKIQCGNSSYGDFLDQRFADIVIGRLQNGVDTIINAKRFNKGINTAVGYNTLLLEWDNGVAKVFAGNNELNFVTKFNVEANNGRSGVYANEKLHVMSLAIEAKHDIAKNISTNWSLEDINNYLLNSKDEKEGYWEYLDRDNNEKKAKIGGRYKFALIKDGEDYVILYISGAVTNKSSWEPGMIKGRLLSTIFENHYDLIWYDSMFEPIETDAHADITDDIILNLQFPIYESSFRLYKMKKVSN